MSRIVVLSGSPSASSRTAVLAAHVAARLTAQGHTIQVIKVRDLPPAALLAGNTADPQIAAAVAAIESADGVVAASPVYKASFSGLLKTLLDLLPQFALAGKVVLPVLTGGTQAHVLALDYALRPVLSSLGADHIVPGWFVLDRTIDKETGPHPEVHGPLHTVVDRFSIALRAPVAV
ncbi:FMN reductase (NADPH) [Pseudonocardiaceae bacterium YIM PH 21723]|nr:FMN reductase (NADPH) [Pseudonocardiaceae bacterium YIM PH 21723]